LSIVFSSYSLIDGARASRRNVSSIAVKTSSVSGKWLPSCGVAQLSHQRKKLSLRLAAEFPFLAFPS
jgi:hypothetical protein